METIKIIDLGSEEKASKKSAGKNPRKTKFKEKARRGYYGDLRLLGLSAGFVLLCILSVLLRSEEAPLMATNTVVEEAIVFAPPIIAATEEKQGLTEAGFVEPAYYGMELDDSLATDPVERTPDQQERLLREMAENIPKGETLIW